MRKENIMIIGYYLSALLFFFFGKTRFHGANEFMAIGFAIVNVVLGTICLIQWIRNNKKDK